MRSRRTALLQLGALGAGAAGMWAVRERLVFPQARPRFTPDADSGGWLPLAQPGLAAVAARAAGRPLGVLLDSGAQTSVLDRRAAARLGVEPGAPIPLLAYGLSGAPQMGRAGKVDVAVGGAILPALHVALLDLSPVVEATDGQVELVLGQDVLRHALLDLDQARGRLALRPSAAPDPPGGVRPLPTRLRGRDLAAPVTVDGAALEAVVDTGSSAALSVAEPLARTLGLLAPGRSAGTRGGVTFGGASLYRLARVDRITWAGEAAPPNAVLQVFPAPAGPLAPPGALLGLAAMDGRRVRLRLGAGRLDLVGPRAIALGLRPAAPPRAPSTP